MRDKLYVGFGHKARQGKDSLARLINVQYPALTKVIGFADALKAYCRVLHGMREKDPSLLQRVGTECRVLDDNTWIRALEWTVQDALQPIILITDLRYENEAAFIEEHDGALVRVRRVLPGGTQFISPDRDPHHESETALDDYAWPMTIDLPDGNFDVTRIEASRLGAAIVKGFNERCKQRLASEGPRVTLH